MSSDQIEKPASGKQPVASGSAEMWKAVQQAIPLTERLGKFVGRIVGPSAFALGGILGDQMKHWRASNLDRIAMIWEKKRKERGINEDAIKALPFRDAMISIDAASQEDDGDVQDLWAELLLNAATAEGRAEVSRMHVDILRTINGLEARILARMFDDFGEIFVGYVRRKPADLFEEVDGEDIRVALLDLQRLGVIAPDITEYEILDSPTVENWADKVQDSNLKEEFLRVVTNIVVELTNLTGSPMNDMAIETVDEKAELIRGHCLTRIGHDLYGALGYPT